MSLARRASDTTRATTTSRYDALGGLARWSARECDPRKVLASTLRLRRDAARTRVTPRGGETHRISRFGYGRARAVSHTRVSHRAFSSSRPRLLAPPKPAAHTTTREPWRRRRRPHSALARARPALYHPARVPRPHARPRVVATWSTARLLRCRARAAVCVTVTVRRDPSGGAPARLAAASTSPRARASPPTTTGTTPPRRPTSSTFAPRTSSAT